MNSTLKEWEIVHKDKADSPHYMAVIKQIDAESYFAYKIGDTYGFMEFDFCTVFYNETNAKNMLEELNAQCSERFVLLTLEHDRKKPKL